MVGLLELLIRVSGLDRAQLNLVALFSWRLFVFTHIMFVCGWFAVFGLHSPFATAAEQQDLKTVIGNLTSVVQEDRIERMEHEILYVRTAQCAATGAARAQYSLRLADLVNRYFALVQRSPRVPGCDEI